MAKRLKLCLMIHAEENLPWANQAVALRLGELATIVGGGGGTAKISLQSNYTFLRCTGDPEGHPGAEDLNITCSQRAIETACAGGHLEPNLGVTMGETRALTDVTPLDGIWVKVAGSGTSRWRSATLTAV